MNIQRPEKASSLENYCALISLATNPILVTESEFFFNIRPILSLTTDEQIDGWAKQPTDNQQSIVMCIVKCQQLINYACQLKSALTYLNMNCIPKINHNRLRKRINII